MPDPVPMAPRTDDCAGDMTSLVRLGLAEPQPVPSYQGLFLEPDIPPPDENDE
ncbi:hypothetical protein [Streptomyces indicus]|uniref:Uncharacterized protein n=1 Tax=Streptomyces indicus TaxID=417292 RepID=A0A1G9IQL8_9ACTN|nr:hypothetical protein [Streptomyces indicus]SDL27447.1 hypothetical protein SAMN05421806_1259 [Streptomyces indicus]